MDQTHRVQIYFMQLRLNVKRLQLTHRVYGTFAEDFTLTVGVRYAWDEVTAEENLFRYTEIFSTVQVLARFITDDFASPIDTATSGALYALNAANGGFELDANGDVALDQYGQPIGTT